ncbi:unnamed protein product [Larinioides sclopetarius]|uniref:Uncharacterized protein n=1 Tax=Larinioides sclopetarius TaxID=280406 RepID=A0AAV2BWX9_9ARAC
MPESGNYWWLEWVMPESGNYWWLEWVMPESGNYWWLEWVMPEWKLLVAGVGTDGGLVTRCQHQSRTDAGFKPVFS